MSTKTEARRMLTWPEVVDRVPYHRATIARMIQRGQFPEPVQVGPGRVAFFEDEIADWQNALPRGSLPLADNLDPKRKEGKAA